MTKERIAELRAKFENPEYINKACSDIGSRLADVWSENDYALKNVKNKIDFQIEQEELHKKRNEDICRDYQSGKYRQHQLAKKYAMSQGAICKILKKRGIT
jgi:hypothetical protein